MITIWRGSTTWFGGALVALLLCQQALSAAASEPVSRVVATRPAASVPAGELRPILSPEAARKGAVELIDRFVAHVQGSPDVEPAARKAVVEGWKAHREEKEPQGFMTAALAIVSPTFRTALDAMEKEDYALAEKALGPLMADRDAYIALHATAMLARALVEQDRTDQAELLLAALVGREAELMEKTFLEAEVDFLAAYCQVLDLRYEEALASLRQFELQHPGAPDKYRLPARQMLQELSVRRPEGLGDVSDLMTYASRRLARGSAGQPVRDKQQRAVELLDKLIQDAEAQEKQQQPQRAKGGKGGQGGKAQGNPVAPASDSMLPSGEGGKGPLQRRATVRPGEQWGQMRPEERQRILQSLRESFPSRYRQLVEQYYRQLAKEE
ncbi:MAG: hypothetical protein KA354_02160 [Phycisphaerae bacterium]|nr:hypothetical protein [Phycisphaerae bacterium]